jgi:type II secretory pathway pseudopilin PulG
MAFVIDDILIATAVIAAAGATASTVMSGAAQRDAMKLQQKQQALEAAKQKRDMIRQTRIAYATAQSNAENQGVAGSSSALGGAGSIRSQLSGNLSFLDQSNALSKQITSANMSASSWASTASMFSAAGDLATLGSSSAAKKTFGKIFKGG